MPGFTCAVPGCYNNSSKHKHLNFYGFPKNQQLREKWLRNIKRRGENGYSEFKPTNGHRICSEHFTGGKKTYMNNIPSIFPLISVETVKKGSSKQSRASNEYEDYKPPQMIEHSYSLACGNSELEKLLKMKENTIWEMEKEIEKLKQQLSFSINKILSMETVINKKNLQIVRSAKKNALHLKTIQILKSKVTH